MQIKVNLVSGEIYTFDMPVEKELTFLDQLRPMEMFERPLHQFLGKLCTVSINPAVVEWIELDTSEFPSASQQAKTMTLRQLSSETFKDRVTECKDALVASMESDTRANVLTAYGKAVFKSSRTMFFEIRAKFDMPEERIKAAQRVFEMPALFVYGELSGLYIVNTKNIAVWHVVPGLKKSAFFSVTGELVGTSRA